MVYGEYFGGISSEDGEKQSIGDRDRQGGIRHNFKILYPSASLPDPST